MSSEGIAALVAELLSGLEGVTPGPWSSDSIKSDGSYGSGDDCHEGFDTYAVYSDTVSSYGHPSAICDALNSDTGEVHEEWDEDGHSAWDEQARKNMEHIARCSPDNIRRLATALVAQEAEIAALRAKVERYEADALTPR